MSNPLKLPWPSGYLPPVRKGREGEEAEKEGGGRRRGRGGRIVGTQNPQSKHVNHSGHWKWVVWTTVYMNSTLSGPVLKHWDATYKPHNCQVCSPELVYSSTSP